MCIVSMVMDHYRDVIPRIDPPWLPSTPTQPWPFGGVPDPAATAAVAELRQLIAEFREAVAGAKRLDVLTKQPDCVDPEKAKLEERVAELERRLAAVGL